MKNNNVSLANLSDYLDSKKLNKIAAKIDEANKNILKIKTAQYLGQQGYWIRNERCWSNCYRVKRAKLNKPAQEIWFECLKEYGNSLNDVNSDWNKYANDKSVIKTASSDAIIKENKKFNTVFSALLKDNMPIQNAVKTAISLNKDIYEISFDNQIKQLEKVAKQLRQNKLFKSASKLDKINDQLKKEAQAMWALKNLLPGKIPGVKKYKNWQLKTMLKWLNLTLKKFKTLYSRIPAGKILLPEQTVDLVDSFKKLRDQAQNDILLWHKKSANSTEMANLYAASYPYLEEFLNARPKTLQDVKKTLSPIISGLSNISNDFISVMSNENYGGSENNQVHGKENDVASPHNAVNAAPANTTQNQTNTPVPVAKQPTGGTYDIVEPPQSKVVNHQTVAEPVQNQPVAVNPTKEEPVKAQPQNAAPVENNNTDNKVTNPQQKQHSNLLTKKVLNEILTDIKGLSDADRNDFFVQLKSGLQKVFNI